MTLWPVELYPRVALLVAWVRGGAYLSVSFMSVHRVRSYPQPHAVYYRSHARVGANCEGEAGAVGAGSVVAAQGCGGAVSGCRLS